MDGSRLDRYRRSKSGFDSNPVGRPVLREGENCCNVNKTTRNRALLALIILISGIALLFEYVPTYLVNREFAEGGSDVAKGVVVDQRTFTKSTGRTGTGSSGSATYSAVSYRFSVGGTHYFDVHESRKRAFRALRKGDEIEIRHSRKDPDVNRPAMITHATVGLRIGIGAGAVLVVGSLVALGVLFIRRDPGA